MNPKNKKNVVIIGGGGHARVILSIINQSREFKMIGYTDNIEQEGMPNYLGKDEILLRKKNEYVNLVIGISYIKNVYNSLRKKIINKFYSIEEYNFPIITSKYSYIDENTIIKAGTIIGNACVINTCSKINEFCVINTNSTIEHNCILGFNTQVSPGTTLLGNVETGNHVFIGAGSTVLEDISITDNVIIGAGSLVTKNITRSGLYYGNPARFIKYLAY